MSNRSSASTIFVQRATRQARPPRSGGIGGGQQTQGSGSLKFYLTGLVYLLVGIIIGTGLWVGWSEPLRIGIPKETHIHAHSWGFAAPGLAGPGQVLRPSGGRQHGHGPQRGEAPERQAHEEPQRERRMGDPVGATVDFGVTERFLARDQEGTRAVARDDFLELVGDGEFGGGIHGHGGLDAPVHDLSLIHISEPTRPY